MKPNQRCAWVIALLLGCLGVVAAEPDLKIKLTGIACFRGRSLALCELSLRGGTLRPILATGERIEGIEVLSIDEMKGTITLQRNNQSQVLAVTEADAPDGPPGRTFNLKAVDSSQLLEIYQTLADRTVLRSPNLPG